MGMESNTFVRSVGLLRHQFTLFPAPKPPWLTLHCTVGQAYPEEAVCFHCSDSRLGTKREIIFGNLIFQPHAPPGFWNPGSSSFFILCLLVLLPLPSAVLSSLAHLLIVKHNHQQKLVISLSMGPNQQLTETEEN